MASSNISNMQNFNSSSNTSFKMLEFKENFNSNSGIHNFNDGYNKPLPSLSQGFGSRISQTGR